MPFNQKEAMKLAVTRASWTRFELPEPAWIELHSTDSKDTRVFWLCAGTWAAREVFDPTTHLWRFSCVRRQEPKTELVMERV